MTLYDQLRRKIPLADQLRSKASYRQQLNAAVRGLWLGAVQSSGELEELFDVSV